MAQVIQNMYSSVDYAAQQFAFLRNFAAPLDINQVMHSVNDLENYLTESKNAYPGQIIAIDDNLSDDPKVYVENRDEIGLYYVYYDKDNSRLKCKKIAFLDSVLNNTQPWQVMSDNDNETDEYNIDNKLYTDIISQYNEAGISFDIKPNIK